MSPDLSNRRNRLPLITGAIITFGLVAVLVVFFGQRMQVIPRIFYFIWGLLLVYFVWRIALAVEHLAYES